MLQQRFYDDATSTASIPDLYLKRKKYRVFQWAIPGLFFFIFIFFHFNVQLVDEILSMLGFKLSISGVGSDRSTNWATTIAPKEKKSLGKFLDQGQRWWLVERWTTPSNDASSNPTKSQVCPRFLLSKLQLDNLKGSQNISNYETQLNNL